MFKELTLISLVVVSIQAKTMCRLDSECASDQCCYYHEGPMIVSKRNVFLPFNAMHQGGWCETYLAEGARCNPFSKLNGHCSCGNGLTCTRFPYTTTSSVIKRKLLPGDYLCSPTP
ncbi:Hypothetical predicted protein [Mytilus galloprovincialis]|uniref:Prokineticin domain-containing protein n=1 Tax=Mytilus galloprovincialis TaxID=29158 RepID=A0A8B6BNZ1_MYTGA|nr:Hypothetical predicted protein [Mytilus galloprovincialis]